MSKQITITKCGTCWYGKNLRKCILTDADIEKANDIHKDCPLAERVSRERAMSILASAFYDCMATRMKFQTNNITQDDAEIFMKVTLSQALNKLGFKEA